MILETIPHGDGHPLYRTGGGWWTYDPFAAPPGWYHRPYALSRWGRTHRTRVPDEVLLADRMDYAVGVTP